MLLFATYLLIYTQVVTSWFSFWFLFGRFCPNVFVKITHNCHPGVKKLILPPIVYARSSQPHCPARPAGWPGMEHGRCWKNWASPLSAETGAARIKPKVDLQEQRKVDVREAQKEVAQGPATLELADGGEASARPLHLTALPRAPSATSASSST